MARPREPIRLIEAKGKKHLTKAEVEERLASEPQPVTDGIAAPSFLTAGQKKRFDKIAGQLQKIKIMGETDVEVLARYIEAQMLYEDATKELRRLKKERPKRGEDEDLDTYLTRLGKIYELEEVQVRRQDRTDTASWYQSTARHEESGGKPEGPPSKPKYDMVTDSA